MVGEPRIVFAGRIYPERVAVTVVTDVGDLALELALPDGQRLPARITMFPARITMDASQVVVSMGVPSEPVDIPTLRNAIQGLVASFADIVGWSNGCGYLTEITPYATAESQGIFGVQIPVLATKTSRLATSEIFMLLAGADGVYLRRALADFRSAVLAPDDTPFFCFRAVESVVRHFAAGRTGARAALTKALRVDDAWIVLWLQRPANEIRHGASVPVSDESRQRAFLASREVIERYMVWLTAGKTSLPISTFPRLRRTDDPLLLRA